MVERSRARQKNAAEGPSTASRGPMKNPSRERLQAELHLLRTQIVRLELQVNELKETKRQERARVQDAAAVNALVNLSTPSWQLQVLSKQKKRRRIEQERGQLEHQINQQLHVISRLKRLLQKRMDTALPSSPCLPQGNSLWSLYGRFLQDIHVAYLMTDEVLEESTWEATSTRTTAVDCKTGLHLGEEQMYTEFRRQLWVPLPLVQASGKAWTSTANVFRLVIKWWWSSFL